MWNTSRPAKLGTDRRLMVSEAVLASRQNRPQKSPIMNCGNAQAAAERYRNFCDGASSPRAWSSGSPGPSALYIHTPSR